MVLVVYIYEYLRFLNFGSADVVKIWLFFFKSVPDSKYEDLGRIRWFSLMKTYLLVFCNLDWWVILEGPAVPHTEKLKPTRVNIYILSRYLLFIKARKPSLLKPLIITSLQNLTIIYKIHIRVYGQSKTTSNKVKLVLGLSSEPSSKGVLDL